MRNIDTAFSEIDKALRRIERDATRDAISSIYWALQLIRNEIPSLDPKPEDEELDEYED